MYICITRKRKAFLPAILPRTPFCCDHPQASLWMQNAEEGNNAHTAWTQLHTIVRGHRRRHDPHLLEGTIWLAKCTDVDVYSTRSHCHNTNIPIEEQSVYEAPRAPTSTFGLAEGTDVFS